MSRVKRGIVLKRKHNKFLELAKGYRGTKSRIYKKAHEAVLHAGEYAYSGRKQKKRDFRRLWIIRISSACKELNTSYKEFIHLLKMNNILLDRKVLSEIIASDFNTFKKLVEKAKA